MAIGQAKWHTCRALSFLFVPIKHQNKNQMPFRSVRCAVVVAVISLPSTSFFFPVATARLVSLPICSAAVRVSILLISPRVIQTHSCTQTFVRNNLTHLLYHFKWPTLPRQFVRRTSHIYHILPANIDTAAVTIVSSSSSSSVQFAVEAGFVASVKWSEVNATTTTSVEHNWYILVRFVCIHIRFFLHHLLSLFPLRSCVCEFPLIMEM